MAEGTRRWEHRCRSTTGISRDSYANECHENTYHVALVAVLAVAALALRRIRDVLAANVNALVEPVAADNKVLEFLDTLLACFHARSE